MHSRDSAGVARGGTAATNGEKLQPSLRALMPDGQLAGLTAQDAADRLEYLATRK